MIAGAAGGAAGGAGRRGAGRARATLDLSRVAMQPGSAQGFGLLGPDKVPTFLLPANPVSALVVFEVIVRPLLRVMLGRAEPLPPHGVRRGTLDRSPRPPGRRQFLRGQLLRDDERRLPGAHSAAAAPTCWPRWPRRTA